MEALSTDKNKTIVHLLIKSPNQEIDDLKVDCDLSWNVGRLKEHLSEVYPTKPLKSQQRIIYSGRLLPDHLLLTEVVTQGQNVHTMHLVCPHSTNSSKDTEAKPAEPADKSENTSAEPSIPYANVIPPPSLHTDGLRQRFPDAQAYTPNVPGTFNPQSFPVFESTPGMPPYMAYQLAMMQQSYAQAMAQYFSQGAPGYQATFDYPNEPSPVQNPAPQPTVTPPPIVNAPQRPQNRNNEDQQQIDFIDSLYLLTRFAMLIAILFFYSSPGRVLFVMTLVMIYAIYRLSRPRRIRRRVSVPERRAPEPPRNTSGNGSEASTNDNQDTQTSSQANEPSVAAPASVPAGPSTLVVLFTFIKTFFTSLIPEQQPLHADL